MSSVTSCVGGGLFICFTCLHVPYSTVTLIISCKALCQQLTVCCNVADVRRGLPYLLKVHQPLN
jgi:hypothetical protein